MKWQVTWFLSQVCLLIVVVTSQSHSRDTQQVYLDPQEQFLMIWSYNSSHITIELQVNTTGWVGIGFSENGNMVNADIHLGWVDDGTAYITDRHGLSFNGYPPLDAEQNVELLEGWECEGFTYLRFVRQLAGCEETQDRPIDDNTVRIIYAYHDEDPINVWSFNKHLLEHRGAKSLYIFQPQSEPELPETDVSTFDIRSGGVMIPTKSTYYKCILFELPPLDKKHHIIRVEPIIVDKYRLNVHHIILHLCHGLENSSFVGYSEECYIPNENPDLKKCQEIFGGWAIGSGAIIFPDHAGFPIGEPGGSKYIKLEMHYDNPRLIEISDNSGMRIFYTPTLRQYDAGSLSFSHFNNGLFLIVPPRTDSYKIYGGCDSICLDGAMDLAGTQSINVFNLFLHSHLAGRKMRLRHIRNGTELPPIARDDNYDFDYQQPRILSPEAVIRKGDELQVVCEYSSTYKSHAVVGGLDTSKEMCSAFTLYYPKLSVSVCSSGPIAAYTPLMKMVGVQSVKQINLDKGLVQRDLSDVIITLPLEMANKTLDDAVSDYNWNKTSSDYISEYYRLSQRYQVCLGNQAPTVHVRGPLAINNPLPEETPAVCDTPSSGFPTQTDAETCDVIL